jgi:hypothetical protein
MTCQTAVSLGVYVLGAADTSERLRVEAPSARLRGMPRRTGPPGAAARLPARVPSDLRPAAPVPAESSLAAPGPVAAPAGARAAARSGAAPPPPAAPAALGRAPDRRRGGSGYSPHGYLLAPGAAPGQPAAPAVTVSGANPAAHVRAVAALTATSWGTSIRLRVSGLPLNVQCWLVVRSRSGQSEVAGVWDAWSPGPVTVPASAAWRPSDIASLQVKTATRSLVTIAAGRP